MQELSPEQQEENRLKGIEYEKRVARYYEQKGYTIIRNGEIRGKSDGGVDIIAIRLDAESNIHEILLIQCKNYISQNSILNKEKAEKFFKKMSDFAKNRYVSVPSSSVGQYKYILTMPNIEHIELEAEEYCKQNSIHILQLDLRQLCIPHIVAYYEDKYSSYMGMECNSHYINLACRAKEEEQKDGRIFCFHCLNHEQVSKKNAKDTKEVLRKIKENMELESKQIIAAGGKIRIVHVLVICSESEEKVDYSKLKGVGLHIDHFYYYDDENTIKKEVGYKEISYEE